LIVGNLRPGAGASLSIPSSFLTVAMLLILNFAAILQVISTVLALLSKFPTLHQAFALMDRNAKEGETSTSINPKFSSASAIRSEADRLARMICQSVEYCHRQEMGTIGPQSSTYGRWVVGRYYREAGLRRELDWCLNIKNMSGPNSRCGITVMILAEDPDA
jgi:hypothetical protein